MHADQSRLGGFVLIAAVVFASLGAPSLTAQVVQVDVTSLFNADVIVNNGNGLDATQSSIDRGDAPINNYAFPTQSVAGALCGAPSGLPDDGAFAANAFHPAVQLAYDNGNDGNNAFRLPDSAGTFTIDIPDGQYEQVHLFATTGNGDSLLTVTLNYSDLTTSQANVTVPDWFGGFADSASTYHLISERDRVQPGSGPGVAFECPDTDVFDIFGFRLSPDPTKTLQSVRVDRTDTDGILNFFGATAVAAPAAAAQIPSLGPWALALLALALAAAGFATIK